METKADTLNNNTASFNLLDEPWIPVIWRDGRAERVGIKTALTRAGKIRQLAATNPMDNVALLRFLMAILLWCKADAKDELAELLKADANAPGIPEEDWLGNLTKHKDKFNLFDVNSPFMQDIGVKDTKANAATELVHDMPSGSALNHFLHSEDFRDGLCPACCASGLVRWSCYATAGTKGTGLRMTASPNGNTPAYSIDVRGTLLQCLQDSINRVNGAPSDHPIWISSASQATLGLLRGLTWRSRRALLSVPSENDGTPCAYCGAREGGLVREIRFQPGWKRLSDKPWEDDPHLVRVTRQRKKGKPEKVLIAHPSPNDPIDRAAVLWRDLAQGVAERLGTNPADRAVSDVVVLGSNRALLKHVETIRVRPYTESNAKQVSLTKDTADKLRGLVNAAAPDENRAKELGRKRGHPEIKAATVLLTPEAETQVRAALANPAKVGKTGAAADSPEDKAKADKEILRGIYRPVVEQVVEATAKGSPLRRRVAKQHALALLNKNIDAIVDKANQPAAAVEGDAQETPAKAKRSRKKKGD